MSSFDEKSARKMINQAVGNKSLTIEEKTQFAQNVISKVTSPELNKLRAILALALDGLPIARVCLVISEELTRIYDNHTGCMPNVSVTEKASELTRQLAEEGCCPFEIIGIAAGMAMSIAFLGLGLPDRSPLED